MAIRRALVYAPRMPEYDKECGSERIFHFLQFLRQRDWAVSFVANNAEGGERYARELRRLGIVTYAGEDTRLAGDDYITDLSELYKSGRFDLAIYAFWYLGEAHIPALRTYSPDTKIVIDTIDLHFLRATRSAFSSPSNGNTVTPPELPADAGESFRCEINAYAAADAILTVSDKEAGLVRDLLAGSVAVHSIPLAVDMPESPVPRQERKGILFIGNYRHPPNAEAVQFLCEEVLPLVDPDVLRRHPVQIVGNEMERVEVPGQFSEEQVRKVGWVPSLVPYLERARLSVVPVLHGAGTKGKLIQTLTVGTPVVATTMGAEGLDVTDGKNGLIADDAASFADAIERLATEDALWEELSANGRSTAIAAHGIERVQAVFDGVIEQVMQSGAGVGDREAEVPRSRLAELSCTD